MNFIKAAEVIEKTLSHAGMPITEEQSILLAGALAVCMQAAIHKERERCADVAESWADYSQKPVSIGPRIARAIRQ